MYKSPIELIYEDIQSQVEEGIYKAIQKVDIKVDRDELLKALAYDRGQYEKGYEDAKAERKKGKWIPQDYNKITGMVSTAVYYYPKCSVCGQCANYTNFCPNCGAEMDGIDG